MAHARRRSRCKCSDLADEVARELLAAHLLVADAKAPFPYSKTDMKHAPHWAGIWKHRLFLSDLLDGTGGRMLRQKKWHSQLASYVAHAELKISSDDVMQGSYNVRVMLSHLRNAKIKKLSPPKQYVQLSALIDEICIDMRDTDDNDDNDEVDLDDNDNDDEVQVVPGPPVPLVAISSEEEGPRRAVGMDIFDELSQELFHDEKAKEKAKEKDTEKAKEKAKDPAAGAVGDMEMDRLMAMCAGGQAPLPKEYRSKFSKAALKKPASSQKKTSQKTVDPAWHQMQHETTKKKVYSKAYHGTKKLCKEMSADDAKQRARSAGQEAVDRWMATLT